MKHGLYARHYSPEEQAELKRMKAGDFSHEIHLMRVVVKNAFEIQARLHKDLEKVTEKGRKEKVEALAKITNSLANAVTALSTAARTHALMSGKDRATNDALEIAIDSLAIFLDEKHLIEVEPRKRAVEGATKE